MRNMRGISRNMSTSQYGTYAASSSALLRQSSTPDAAIPSSMTQANQLRQMMSMHALGRQARGSSGVANNQSKSPMRRSQKPFGYKQPNQHGQ